MQTNGLSHGNLWEVVSGKFGFFPDDPATLPQTDPKPEDKDWKSEYAKLTESSSKAYTGLQRTLAQEQERTRKAEESATLLTQQLQQLQEGHSTLNTTVQELTGKFDQTKTELTTERVKNARLDLIVKEYPQLAAFEAKSLIPTPTVTREDGSVDVEALRTLFKNYSSELAALGVAAKKDFSTGGTPGTPAPNSNAPATVQMLLKTVQDAALSGDRKAYDAAFNAYEEARRHQS